MALTILRDVTVLFLFVCFWKSAEFIQVNEVLLAVPEEL